MLGDARACELIILGLGNVLCGDDGVGPATVELLAAQYLLPDAVAIVDGGTLGLALVPYIEDAPRLILIDAVASDAPPGSLVRMESSEVNVALRSGVSCHQLGVADLVDVARLRGAAREHLVLFGIVPRDLELGAPRSSPVDESLPSLVAAVIAETERLGYPCSIRASHAQLAPQRANGPVGSQR